MTTNTNEKMNAMTNVWNVCDNENGIWVDVIAEAEGWHIVCQYHNITLEDHFNDTKACDAVDAFLFDYGTEMIDRIIDYETTGYIGYYDDYLFAVKKATAKAELLCDYLYEVAEEADKDFKGWQ